MIKEGDVTDHLGTYIQIDQMTTSYYSSRRSSHSLFQSSEHAILLKKN
uniref:Uncharacterized protein n=1 Tax=Arundo donax TaxID=35708 RepID=A0A0A9DXT5_ARUDO